MAESIKKLYRSRTDRVLFGVCGGLADYFKIDAVIFRILFVLLVLADGAGLLIYLVLALVVPLEPESSGQGAATLKEEAKDAAETVREKGKTLAEEIKADQGIAGRSRNILGALIILAGAIMLLNAIAPFAFRWINWGAVWSILVIAAGVYIISKN